MTNRRRHAAPSRDHPRCCRARRCLEVAGVQGPSGRTERQRRRRRSAGPRGDGRTRTTGPTSSHAGCPNRAAERLAYCSTISAIHGSSRCWRGSPRRSTRWAWRRCWPTAILISASAATPSRRLLVPTGRRSRRRRHHRCRACPDPSGLNWCRWCLREPTSRTCLGRHRRRRRRRRGAIGHPASHRPWSSRGSAIWLGPGIVGTLRRKGFDGRPWPRCRAGRQSIVEFAGMTEEGGYAAAGRLLDRPDRPTAILAFNDVACVGALSAADDRGISRPQGPLVGRLRRHVSCQDSPSVVDLGGQRQLRGRSAGGEVPAAAARRRDHDPSACICINRR